MIGHLETNPITKKPETASHLAEQFSWVPLPYSSPPGCPFPVKSLALSAHVSSDNSFPSVRQESALGALEGRPPLPTTVAMGITYLWPNWPPGLKNTRFHTKISHSQKECNNPLYSQSPL